MRQPEDLPLVKEGLTGQPADVAELANTEALAVSRDISRFLPCGEHAADRVQRRAAHFSNILARERKLDDGILLIISDPSVRQAQQRVSDALIHTLRRQFSQSLLHFPQPIANNPRQIERDLRVSMNQFEEDRLRPTDFDRIRYGSGLRRITAVRKQRDG